jgi:ATP-dependent Clp protease ATP-binding subunit ClpA
MTPRCERVFEVAAVEAKIRQDNLIRDKDILMALLKENDSLPMRMLQKIGLPVDEMVKELLQGEASMFTNDISAESEADIIKKYGRDLTALASQGKLDIIIGREKEINQLERILIRKTKNCPILIGDSGVGKTAIVEGLAKLMVEGKLPNDFRFKRIIEFKLLSGIPLQRLTMQEKTRYLELDKIIKTRVFGQDQAIDRICKPVRTAMSGLKDANRPVGVFLLLGPTGVGKTECAKSLAEALFGSEKEIIRLDMSEFSGKNSVFQLIGYPGYDEGGQLTDKIRRKPYSVVLMDEIEKANPEIFDLFLQVFDEGRITDSKGRLVDLRNAIFLMTSNIGEYYNRGHMGFVNSMNDNDSIKDEISAQLKKNFRPEFLNRIDDVILFQPLSSQALRKIVTKILSGLEKKLEEQGILVDVEETALDLICDKGFDPANGARPLSRTIQRLLTQPFGDKLLAGQLVSGDKVSVLAQDGNIIFVKVKEKTWV